MCGTPRPRWRRCVLAFLVNMTAFPLTSGLLPYVAREIYHIDQTGLGIPDRELRRRLAWSARSRSASPDGLIRPARMMMVFAVRVVRDAAGVRARAGRDAAGRAVLVLAGLAQSLSLVPMSVMLLHGAGAQFRGRVMGVRMLAIYGLPLGLMAAGALIDRFGLQGHRRPGIARRRLGADDGDRGALAGGAMAAGRGSQCALTARKMNEKSSKKRSLAVFRSFSIPMFHSEERDKE